MWLEPPALRFGHQGRHELRPLNNMFPVELNVSSLRARSAESLYQAAKFTGQPEVQLAIASLSGWEAKQEARALRPVKEDEWMQVQRRVMLTVLLIKMRHSPDMRQALKSSSGRPLVEASRSDHYWGAVLSGDRLVGTNMLGRMLMFVRDTTTDLSSWVEREARVIWPWCAPATDQAETYTHADGA